MPWSEVPYPRGHMYASDGECLEGARNGLWSSELQLKALTLMQLRFLKVHCPRQTVRHMEAPYISLLACEFPLCTEQGSRPVMVNLFPFSS